MPTSQSQIEYFQELLNFVPDIKFKKMFDEYRLDSGFDTDKKFFGLICDSRLFLKATESLKKIVEFDGVIPYDGGGKGYYHIDENENENSIEMQLAGWQAILNNFKKVCENHK